MSNYAEMIEAEAAEAEADDELVEEEESDAEPTEPQPEPAPRVTDPEKAFKQIDRENERHAKAIAKIMGPDFDLVHVCPACLDFAAGFTLTPPEEAPAMLHPPEFERCPKCNGYGQVLTGAVVAHGHTQTCMTCTGQGFITVPLEPAPLPPMPGAVSPHASLANELRAQGFTVLDPPAPQPVQQF